MGLEESFAICLVVYLGVVVTIFVIWGINDVRDHRRKKKGNNV